MSPLRHLRLSAALAVLAFMLGLALSHSSASAKEIPLWEGVEKTEEQMRADRDMVEAARVQAHGDLAAAARRAIELGWRAFAEGSPDLAIRRFNQAWLLDPENPALYWGLALATHVRGDETSAVERWFAEAERRLPGAAPLLTDHGRILDERGEPRRALSYFLKALDLDPDYAEAHVGMIRASTEIGDGATASKHVQILSRLQARQ